MLKIVLPIIIIVFLCTFGTLFLLSQIINSQQAKLYLDIMNGTNTIFESLIDVQNTMSKKSIAYFAVTEAINYLQYSIMCDYETAFSIVEKVFHQKEIKVMHEVLLENEKNKVTYLLTY